MVELTGVNDLHKFRIPQIGSCGFQIYLFLILNHQISLFVLNLTYYPNNLYTVHGTVHHIWLVPIWLVGPFLHSD